MAILTMAKVMIACHQTEADQLLESLQSAGIMEVLDAERAMVTKDWPELNVTGKKPRELENLVSRLAVAIEFLGEYSHEKKGILAALAPLTEIERSKYNSLISDKQTLDILENAELCKKKADQYQNEIENVEGHIDTLKPWEPLEIPVQQLYDLEQVSCLTGLVNERFVEEVKQKTTDLGATIQIVNTIEKTNAILVLCLKENEAEVQKTLRAADFDSCSFNCMEGTIKENLQKCYAKLEDLNKTLEKEKQHAIELSKNIFSLGVLFDHYTNMLLREDAKINAPATEQSVIIEGWIKNRDYKRLERIVSTFSTADLSKIEIAEEEEVPVEIENNALARPFEVITRLYGMPSLKDVDPTAYLAPFFALFFGICLTDAGYGILLTIVLWWLIKKTQGDKKALWMFMIGSLVTIVAGALTGGWFGDAIQTMIPENTAAFNVMNDFRNKLMLFDPMTDPMTFFIIAIAIGYVQIQFGLLIGFVNNLVRKDYATAIFNQLTWLIFLNSLLIFGLSKGGMLPAGLSTTFGWIAISQAVLIFLFTERNSGMAGRVGGGVFALFSTVFYFGDILSYVRLMALGMVTAGLGMAVNIVVGLLMDIPYVGFFLGAILFVVGHLFNLAMSTLSSFVHSLRLQFVEFFPKFLVGGGKDFKPLQQSYEHVLIKTEK